MPTRFPTIRSLALVLSLTAAACTSPDGANAQAAESVQRVISTNLAELRQAAIELQSAAPTADVDGWNATADTAAVERMRTAWKRARVAYERVEGAIAVLFPDIDASTDARYDAFLAEGGADTNLFDGQGVTGMHAIERILWADAHPEAVVAFESGLVGYVPASYPTTEQQAREFREGLAQRLVSDVQQMEQEFGSAVRLDAASAFRGVIGSLEEQHEKVNLAATAEEESRYAQFTLGDMRANLEGGEATFLAFRPRLVSLGREELAMAIDGRFSALRATYGAIAGDAIPPVPATWNPDAPSAEDLATPYGQLYTQLTNETDPMREDSLVQLMNEAADALDIAQLPE